jgi:class 3 adenylate cyclase
MAKLRSTDRAKLPDSAFAYVDSKGRRRLPINDESHVRNALARFERVAFEDDASREVARKRLLNAARKYGIVPVGFITGQLDAERTRAVRGPSPLPTGRVTLLMTDIEGSTGLTTRLGKRYPGLLREVRGAVRSAVKRAGGVEVDARADEVFAVFPGAAGAVEAAVAVQLALAERTWPSGVECRIRIGIHSGRPTLTDGGYVGIAVNTVARVCNAGHGGQILVSGATVAAIAAELPAGVTFAELGSYRLRGLPGTIAIHQVGAVGLLAEFPALRIGDEAEPGR